MVPLLSALSLALCHEVLEGGGYQQMGTIKYAKRNLPSCSLRSQFTASQKPPLLFPSALVVPYCNFLVSIWTGFDKRACELDQIHLSLLWQNGFCLHMKHFGSLSLAKCFYVPKAYAKKETSPLSRFARNSLPHKKASRFFVPQCSSGPILPFFGFHLDWI